MPGFYAIALPPATRGIYNTWDEIKGLDKQVYKKFMTREECEHFLCKVLDFTFLLKGNETLSNLDLANCVKVFTDGGAINNGKRDAKTAIGIYIPSLAFELSELTEFKTNNQAELYAAKKGIDKVRDEPSLKGKTILLFTDSGFVMYALWESPNVYMVHVRSHTGLKDEYSLGNEKADKLVCQAFNTILKGTVVKKGGRSFKRGELDNQTLRDFFKGDDTETYIRGLN